MAKEKKTEEQVKLEQLIEMLNDCDLRAFPRPSGKGVTMSVQRGDDRLFLDRSKVDEDWVWALGAKMRPKEEVAKSNK